MHSVFIMNNHAQIEIAMSKFFIKILLMVSYFFLQNDQFSFLDILDCFVLAFFCV